MTFLRRILLVLGAAVLIEVNIQVRSMGPISEMDMVWYIKDTVKNSNYLLHLVLELQHGLLFQTILGRSKTFICWLPSKFS